MIYSCRIIRDRRYPVRMDCDLSQQGLDLPYRRIVGVQ